VDGKIHIGTSGWHYRHWVGPVYGAGMKSEGFLTHYARQLQSVEINATFYKLQSPAPLAKWRDGTPEGFIFSCKASRYITHRKKLKDASQTSERFFQTIDALGSKRGPVLVQLPPRWHVNLQRLEEFLEAVPKRYRLAFEFRDESWFAPSVYQMLEHHNAAFCAYDFNQRQSPVKVTADFTYVRLHGPNGAYRGQYDDKTLAGWAKHLTSCSKDGLDGYCYFDNDEAGYAFNDAVRLRHKLSI
jgi:uncharacterized protein YecE (DUF72 family)